MDYKWSKGERIFWSAVGVLIVACGIIGVIFLAKKIL